VSFVKENTNSTRIFSSGL